MVGESREEEGRALEGWAIRRVVYEVGQNWRRAERGRLAELKMSRNRPDGVRRTQALEDRT